MEFIIKRTSIWDGQPCEEAVLKPYIRIDVRSVNDPAKIPANRGQRDWWYSEGRNHRVEKGHIKRDFDAEDWFITMDTFDDLLSFKKKYGRIIISDSYYNPAILMVEIYDDYRE